MSCISNNSCKEVLEFKIRNSNHAYNCGLKYRTLRVTDDIEYICKEFKELEKVYPITTSYNNGYLSIIMNHNESQEIITLILTVKKGYIFRMQNGLNYKNDELANFFIEKLEIKNVYSDTICN